MIFLLEFVSMHGIFSSLLCINLGPKSYGYLERMPDGTILERIKSKGFPRLGDGEKKLTYAAIKAQAEGMMKRDHAPPITVRYNTMKRTKEHGIQSITVEKVFKPTYDKRFVSPSGSTVPIGWTAIQ